MKYHKILFGICLLLGVVAYSRVLNANEQPNRLLTGGISVDTVIYTLDEQSNRVLLQDGMISDCIAGQEIPYIISVQNLASTSYVRLKISYPNGYTARFKGISDAWVYQNGYYYYKKPMNRDEMVDFCSAMIMPDVDNTLSDFLVQVDAQAIQSANFFPDFASDNPWGDITIDQTLQEEPASSQPIIILCDSEIEDELSHAVLFRNEEEFMPGDEITDCITIKPVKNREFVLRTLPWEVDFEEAKYVRLSIYQDNDLLYEDSLFDTKLLDGIKLNLIPKNQTSNLTFVLSLDINASNLSTWKNINAILQLEDVYTEVSTETTEEVTEEVTEETTEEVQTEEIHTDVPAKTGDSSIYVVMIIMISLLALIGLFVLRKECRNE